jgi:L-ascorbate metabolism protein UlaG (beta-lactamase superfamily)
MDITYLGHACFEIELAGKRLLIDPFISPNPLASDISIEELKPDYILITHGHEDHLADVEKIYNQSKPLLVSNFEIISWFANKGLSNGHPMNHGGSKTFDFGDVKMVNAVHSSALPDGSNGGNPAGFVISSADTCLYFAGDTALTYDMKLIGEEFSVDLAFMPIGDNFTMGVQDAVKAAKFVGTRKVIGMHYNTFPMIEIDVDSAKEEFRNNGIELTLMSIGETIAY